MASVIIRGRINTTALAAGQTAEVERTDRIDRLVDKGYVEIVGDTVVNPEPIVSGPSVEIVGEVPPVEGTGSGIQAWRKFMQDNGFELAGDESKTDLIELWQGDDPAGLEADAQNDGPAEPGE